MLKSLWNSVRGAGKPEEARGAALDPTKLAMVVEHFGIGRKVRYYPEFQREIVFDTLVIGYRVNDHYLYSREAIEYDAGGAGVAFLVGERKARLPLGEVTDLRLVVPDTSDMERSLDYFRRATIGRAGQFRQGNAITLIADTGARGVPTVDTQVEHRMRLKDGPYADSQTILLKPELETLVITDQRRKERVESRVPADLFTQGDAPPLHCALGDFSDTTLRLLAADGGQPMPPLEPNDQVIVVIDLGNLAGPYRIRGTVFRATVDSCVIRLDQIYRDGAFANFKMMDVFEIKSGLLNYRC